MRANGELTKNGRPPKLLSDSIVFLADVDVSPNESANWGKLAAAKKFDAILAQVAKEIGELTEASAPKAAASRQAPVNIASMPDANDVHRADGRFFKFIHDTVFANSHSEKVAMSA
jgi:hypothetical protein